MTLEVEKFRYYLDIQSMKGYSMVTIQDNLNTVQFSPTEEQQKIIDNENKVLATYRPYCFDFAEAVSVYEMALRFAKIYPLEKITGANIGVFAKRCGYTYKNFQRVIRAEDGTKYFKKIGAYFKGIIRHPRRNTLRNHKAYKSDSILLEKQSRYKGEITRNANSCPFQCFLISKINV